MTCEKHPDLEIDVCPACKGIFLDKGELDTLITARGHSVETIPNMHGETELRCPACDSVLMEASLLLVDRVKVEICKACRGIFLDRAELHLINTILREDGMGRQEGKIRKYVKERLVTVHVLSEAAAAIRSQASGVPAFGNRVHVRVYYKKPLGNEFTVLRANTMSKLLAVIGIRRGIVLDQITQHFASNYVVYAKDPMRAIQSLGHGVQTFVEKIDRGELRILDMKGQITLLDNGLQYTEGLYSDSRIQHILIHARDLADQLVDLARLVDRQN